jgi:hypothetical protein
MNVQEGNKLIAEFMGYQINYGFKKDGILFAGQHINVKKLLYHKSWNWLMPVIGKISNQCEEPEELDDLKYALLTNNIEEAYIFVTSYIESYNSLDINKVLNNETD